MTEGTRPPFLVAYLPSGRLWSLRDMLGRILGPLYYCISRAELARNRISDMANPLSDERVDELRGDVKKIITDLRKHCEAAGLISSVAFIDSMPLYKSCDRIRIAFVLEGIVKTIENEGSERYVYPIAKAKSDLFLVEMRRWAAITGTDKFPSAGTEALSALKCYSGDEDTACVFHLMRIAEIGLRALARERRVRIPKKPLDWAEWQEILTHLGKKVDEIGKKKRGPTKDAALAFYQGALGEFAAFKDTYRNVVMHVRKTYDEHEAASALLHVREFMERLSSRLSENQKGAIKWGKF